jgi:hypothetical protein
MMVIAQKQVDMVLTYSASSALDTSQMVLVAQKSDQRGMSIENRLETLEHYLEQMVQLLSKIPESFFLELLLTIPLSNTTTPTTKFNQLSPQVFYNRRYSTRDFWMRNRMIRRQILYLSILGAERNAHVVVQVGLHTQGEPMPIVQLITPDVSFTQKAKW